MTLVPTCGGDLLLAGTTLQSHAAEGGSSVWEHIPELIVLAVGFIGFTAYAEVERRNERRRAAALAPANVDGRQWLTVALLVVAALAHIPVLPQHLREAPYMGILFIAFAIAAFGLAALIARTPTVTRYAAAAVLSAAAIGAYVATRLIAFPELADDVGAWQEPLGVLSVLSEAAVVVAASMEWRRRTDRRDDVTRVAAY